MTCGIVVQTFTVWRLKADGDSQWFLPIPTRTDAHVLKQTVCGSNTQDTRWPACTRLNARRPPSCHCSSFLRSERIRFPLFSSVDPVWRATRKSSGNRTAQTNVYLLISHRSLKKKKNWYHFITHDFPFVTHPSSVKSTLKLILCLFLLVMFCVGLLIWYRRPPVRTVAAVPCQSVVFPVSFHRRVIKQPNKNLASESLSTEK